MNNKYGWSNVPDSVSWISTDADGVKSGWSEKPVCGRWMWGTNIDDNGWVCNIKPFNYYPDQDCPNWEDSLEERPKRLELTQEFIDIINNVCGVKFELSNRKRDTNILNKGGYICILDNEVKFQLNFNGVYIDDVIDVNITEEDLITFLKGKVRERSLEISNQLWGLSTKHLQWLRKLGDD